MKKELRWEGCGGDGIQVVRSRRGDPEKGEPATDRDHSESSGEHTR